MYEHQWAIVWQTRAERDNKCPLTEVSRWMTTLTNPITTAAIRQRVTQLPEWGLRPEWPPRYFTQLVKSCAAIHEQKACFCLKKYLKTDDHCYHFYSYPKHPIHSKATYGILIASHQIDDRITRTHCDISIRKNERRTRESKWWLEIRCS